MKKAVDKLSTSNVILMCGPAGAGKSTFAKKFESNGMTILSYDKESFKRGLNVHPLPQEVVKDIKSDLDRMLIEPKIYYIMTPKEVILERIRKRR